MSCLGQKCLNREYKYFSGLVEKDQNVLATQRNFQSAIRYENSSIQTKKTKKETKKMKAQNSIMTLEDYCLSNSLPKPVFSTNKLVLSKKYEVGVKVGSHEAYGSGKLITAKKDAANNLLTKLRGLEIQKPEKETMKSLQKQKLSQIRPKEVVKPLLPHQLHKKENENTDYEVLSKVPDTIPNLAKYCHENSLPEPIFITNNFGIYQEVVAQVGTLEFVSKDDKVQNATRGAVYGLLNKIKNLEWEELDLIRTESTRVPNAAGKILLLILFFTLSFDFIIDYIFKILNYSIKEK